MKLFVIVIVVLTLGMTVLLFYNERAWLRNLLEIYKEGKLKTIIDRQYPLGKLAEAHRYIETGRKKWNLVVQHS